jgi:histidyl-tRNA synthetase
LNHFEIVKQTLSAAQIPFEIDAKLVRGLDYYTHTTFEIVSTSVGAQSALCGGGRYNGLVEQIGGSDLPGVGFAAGMERVLLACENENSILTGNEGIDLYFVMLDKSLRNFAFQTALELRRKNVKVEVDYLNRSVKAQMREANRMNAKFVMFIGGDEYANDEVVIKKMENGVQVNVLKNDLEKIIETIAEK